MAEQVFPLVKEITPLTNIRIMGLMTMGPFTAEPEELRPCFRKTKEIFDFIKAETLKGLR
ncbi:MAG: hypothetical protein GX846_07450 [Deltaproteobacteria bacterium]|nr:hypothetical protein [Deltaproteobacteria bacterium]